MMDGDPSQRAARGQPAAGCTVRSVSRSASLESPEARLILSCVSRSVGADHTEEPLEFLDRDLDWPLLLDIAERHRVIPIVHRCLSGFSPERVPVKVSQELRQRFLLGARHNLLLTRALGSILECFRESRLRALPYKGVILAQEVYGGVSLRQVYDVDLLVAEADYDRGRQILVSRGYRPAEIFDQERSFRHPETEVEIDVHWGVTPRYFALDFDFERLWERRVPVMLQGEQVWTLSPEDQVVILSVQLAKDCWERYRRLEHLLKVADLAALARTHETLDWAGVEERARFLGIERIVRFALSLTTELLGATLPREIQVQVEGDREVATLVRSISLPMLESEDRTAWRGALRERLAQLAFYLRMRERARDRARHCAEILRTALRT